MSGRPNPGDRVIVSPLTYPGDARAEKQPWSGVYVAGDDSCCNVVRDSTSVQVTCPVEAVRSCKDLIDEAFGPPSIGA